MIVFTLEIEIPLCPNPEYLSQLSQLNMGTQFSKPVQSPKSHSRTQHPRGRINDEGLDGQGHQSWNCKVDNGGHHPSTQVHTSNQIMCCSRVIPFHFTKDDFCLPGSYGTNAEKGLV